jgi:hypothetical protein
MTYHYNLTTGCRLIVDAVTDHITEEEFVRRVTQCGLATAEELDAMKNYTPTWMKHPAAFYAAAHCEVIGKKA